VVFMKLRGLAKLNFDSIKSLGRGAVGQSPDEWFSGEESKIGVLPGDKVGAPLGNQERVVSTGLGRHGECIVLKVGGVRSKGVVEEIANGVWNGIACARGSAGCGAGAPVGGEIGITAAEGEAGAGAVGGSWPWGGIWASNVRILPVVKVTGNFSGERLMKWSFATWLSAARRLSDYWSLTRCPRSRFKLPFASIEERRGS